jgi:transmembrane sensor
MEKEEIISIAVKVSEGTATSEEMAMYIYHIDSFIKEYPEWEDLNVVIEAQLRSDIYAQVNDGQLKIKSYKLWLRIISIAAAISFIFLGIYFINYRNDKYPGIDNSVVQDVKPGKNGATLTLASGKKSYSLTQ